VHLPKSALGASGFGSLGGQQGLVVDADQGKIAKNDAQIISVLVFQTR
jgi:hypothetical protein